MRQKFNHAGHVQKHGRFFIALELRRGFHGDVSAEWKPYQFMLFPGREKISEREIAARLECSRDHIVNLIERREMPARRHSIGKHRYWVRVEDFTAWVWSRTYGHPSFVKRNQVHGSRANIRRKSARRERQAK